MLLAIDAGNSHITIGLFENGKLSKTWRLRTIRDQTSDELGIMMRSLFELQPVEGVIIASVVPPLDAALRGMSRDYFHSEPLFITPDTDIGIPVLYDNPREVGADRVVDGVAAFRLYGGPCVVADLGTTINFDVVSRKGEYLGGLICPGIGISIESLAARTARLPGRRFQTTGEAGRIEYGWQHSIGPVLRFREHDRWYSGTPDRGARTRYENGGDGWAGAPDQAGIAVDSDSK